MLIKLFYAINNFFKFFHFGGWFWDSPRIVITSTRWKSLNDDIWVYDRYLDFEFSFVKSCLIIIIHLWNFTFVYYLYYDVFFKKT